jgi:hypothetical protein
MAFRTEKRTGIVAVLALAIAPALFAQTELRFEVRHDHWRKYGAGALVVSERGVSFQELTKKQQVKHAFKLDYQDIQELRLSADKLTLVTYTDRKWLLGVDKEYEFTLTPGQSFSEVYTLLKDRLDQRFVAAVADEQIQPLWEVPVKLLGRVTGSEGFLEVGADHIVYKTTKKGQSRTWRYADIENISDSGPFQLTLTTYERAKTHYGNLKGFNFQLKQALDEKRFNLLWRRINQTNGLELLTAAQEKEKKQ